MHPVQLSSLAVLTFAALPVHSQQLPQQVSFAMTTNPPIDWIGDEARRNATPSPGGLGAAVRLTMDEMPGVPASASNASAISDNPLAPEASSPSSVSARAGNAAPEKSKGFVRWVDVKDFSFAFRYRNTADSNGFHLFEFGQQRSVVDGDFRLDRQGRYLIHAHASSGKYFNWAYSDVWGGSFGDVANKSLSFYTGAQLEAAGAAIAVDPFFQVVNTHLNSRGWGMSIRQLSLSATPVPEVTAEFGGLGIERGVNSEMTSYDDDGYMTGARVRIHDAKHLYFNEVSFTNGYLGDIYFPSIFDRGNRFTQANYRQIQLQKTLPKGLNASADYSYHLGTETLREAVSMQTPAARIVDGLLIESYQRVNAITLQGQSFSGGAGFGITAKKNLWRHASFEGGYAQIDGNYPVYTGSRFMVAVGHPLNGDQYAIGKRFFTRANVPVSEHFSVFGFFTHDLDTPFLTLNKQGFTAGGSYHFESLFHRAKATL